MTRIKRGQDYFRHICHRVFIRAKNHIEDIIQDGLPGYQYFPFPVNLYWTLLTVLDPLAIILLFFLPFWGMIPSVWIMATDIAVNLSVAWYYDWPTGVFADGRLGLQIAFGLFVFFTMPHRSL